MTVITVTFFLLEIYLYYPGLADSKVHKPIRYLVLVLYQVTTSPVQYLLTGYCVLPCYLAWYSIQLSPTAATTGTNCRMADTRATTVTRRYPSKLLHKIISPQGGADGVLQTSDSRQVPAAAFPVRQPWYTRSKGTT